jgi:hypothetical protein
MERRDPKGTKYVERAIPGELEVREKKLKKLFISHLCICLLIYFLCLYLFYYFIHLFILFSLCYFTYFMILIYLFIVFIYFIYIVDKRIFKPVNRSFK